MNIRLIGSPDELAIVLADLRERYRIVEQSPTYPSRRNPEDLRVYIELRPQEGPPR